MKKYVKNTFLINFIFLIMLSCIGIVKADGELTCNGSVTMTETTMSYPTKIEVKMPVCGKMAFKQYVETKVSPGLGVPEGGTQDFGDLSWVKRIGELKDTKMVNTEDNKGTVPATVVLCGSSNTKIRARAVCTYTDSVDRTVTYEKKKQWYRSTKRQGEYDTCINTYNTCVENFNKCMAPCMMSTKEPIKPKVTLESELIENPNIIQTVRVPLDPICSCTSCTNNCASSYPEDLYNLVDDTTKPIYGCEDENYTYNETTEKCENTNAKWNFSTDASTDLPNNTTGLDISVATAACTAAGKASCTCDASTITYAHMCPEYECQKEDKDVKICTPRFIDDSGNTVYCVNPGQPFSPGYSTTASYKEDNTFSVNDCETSYSTVDCGYANILIEAEYANKEANTTLIEDKTVEFALRLWGVHTQQAGFDYVGVSNRTGDSCDTKTYFMKSNGSTGNIINPYVETYNEFARVLLDSVRYRDDIDPAGDVSMFELTCSNKLGVACGTDIRYKRALALLANTVIGNSKMQEHLKALFNEEITEEVTGAELITTEEGTQYIQTTFSELTKVTKNKNVKIDCKKLDDMVKSGKITQQQKTQIEKFCKVEAYLVDASGRVISEYDGGTPDYCYKNYCRTKTKSFAICDIEEIEKRPTGIKVTYNISQSSKSIKKYVSCSNPVNNQLLFGFDEDLLDSVSSDPTISTEEIPYERIFKLLDFKCQGTCDDYDLRVNIKDRCDDNKKYYGTYDSSVKDPSLKCILNMDNPAIKSTYDYSQDFAAENRFCKVYCSDEVVFHIADKTKETSGRVFYYDVEGFQKKRLGYLFSNVIEEKRTCVSEIKYLNNKFTEDYDWAKIYHLGTNERGQSDGITEEEINGIENWSTLFDVLIKKARTEGGRTENINRILYDLLNCNLYTEKEIKDAGVVKPKNYKVSNIREKILNKFSSTNKYGLGLDSNCSMNPTNGETPCFSMYDINYDFGGKPDGQIAKMKFKTEIDNEIKNLVYCSGTTCFEYDPENKDEEYDYPTGTTNRTTTKNIASDLGGSGKVVSSGDLTIPTNDYVMFDVKATVSFYNSSRYEVKPSGKVITAGKEPGSNLIKLNAFSYPIDRFAYNSNVCSDRTFLVNDRYKRCNITQKYENIETFFRKTPQDEFYNEVNLHKEFKCYVDIEMPEPECDPTKQICRIGTTFRNIDVANIFPSSKDGFTTRSNSNWGTANGKKVTLQILESSDKLNVTNDYLQYRIVLSPNQIKSIQQYNKENNSSYIEEEELNCEIVNGTYRNCVSPFVEELRKSKEYGNLDEKYRGLN